MEKQNNVILSDEQFKQLLEAISTKKTTPPVNPDRDRNKRFEDVEDGGARNGGTSARPKRGDFSINLYEPRLSKKEILEKRKTNLKSKK